MIISYLVVDFAHAQVSLQLTTSNYNGFHVSCFGASDGAIDLTISGGTSPYSISWSNGAITEDISGLPAGYYRVTVDDADTLTPPEAAEITLSEPRKLLLTVTPFVFPNGYNISLYGACNGSASLSAAEGVTPYTWLWSDGNTSQSRSSMCAGIFTVTVSDDNGCTDKNPNLVLTQPDRSDWQTGGNTGSNPNTHFLGTTDNQDVVFKTNSTEVMRLETAGVLRLSSLTGSGDRNVMADSLGRLYMAPCQTWYTCGNNLASPEYFGTRSTSPYKDLVIKTNGVNRMRILGTGEIYLDDFNNLGAAGIMQIDDQGLLQRLDYNPATPYKFLDATGSFSDIPSGSYAWTLNANTIYTMQTGNVGIGTPVPGYRLELVHNSGSPAANGIKITNSAAGNNNSELKFANSGGDLWAVGCDLMHDGDDNFFIYDNDENATRFYIDDDGRVGIGTIPPVSWNNSFNVEYKLYVADGIATRDVKVQATGWPDYVFDDEYKLMSIRELDRYLKTHRHLPGLKPATEMERSDGFEIGAHYKLLLEKVEEQALYIIDLQNQIDILKRVMDRMVEVKSGSK